ncbi:MAG: hypothetical protein ACRC1U_02585, partial [Vibrionaceae bacterium]
DAACEVVSAIYNNKQSEHYVIAPHHGHVTNIPADWTVEMTCTIGADGAKPHPRLTQFNPKVTGLIHMIKSFEQAAGEAAISGKMTDLLLAMNLNPLIHSDLDAKTIAQKLLLAHKKHLPQFAKAIDEITQA